MPQVSNLTQINTLYSQLSYGTLYNWQVVAKNVCNNMVRGPVQQFFVRHLPDLIVESMIIPSTAFSEQTISVEWVIDNQGLGVTNPGTWFDNIYLSNDATYNSFDPLLNLMHIAHRLSCLRELMDCITSSLKRIILVPQRRQVKTIIHPTVQHK